MKPVIDKALCTGCGLCVDMCPSVFQLGADGLAEVVGTDCDQATLEEAVSSCPVNAIELK